MKKILKKIISPFRFIWDLIKFYNLSNRISERILDGVDDKLEEKEKKNLDINEFKKITDDAFKKEKTK